MGHISDAISPTDFILGTMVQPNKAHSMTQDVNDLDLRSRSKVKVNFFPKMGKNPKNWSHLGGYFTYRLHTWYQVSYNPIRCIQ